MNYDTRVSSALASEMLARQLSIWPLAKKNYEDLKSIRTKSIDMGGFTIEVQFNPARITSTNAKFDPEATEKRKCFLCTENLPKEQITLVFEDMFNILCNPYPIFKEHFTIANLIHTKQNIETWLMYMLELARQMNHHTIFYNGPQSGASAPRHAHFQAVTPMMMPIERELDAWLNNHGKIALEWDNSKIIGFTGYLRNGFVIESGTIALAMTLFGIVYRELSRSRELDVEPGLNLFCKYEKERWQLIFIPRRKHRPWQFDATGKDRFLSSPGAVEVGGVFITPREEDFEKADAALIKDIYSQVCYPDCEIEEIVDQINRESKES